MSGSKVRRSPGSVSGKTTKADTKTAKKDDKKGKKGDKNAVEPPKVADAKPADPPKKRGEKGQTIDEIVKDYEKLPGLFTLYRKKDKDSGRETIYLEIKEAQLDKLMLLQATLATGTSGRAVAGNPVSDTVFKFSRVQDDKLNLVKPNIDFRAKEGTPISRSVKRSFPDAYLEAYKIEAKQDDRKSLLINISEFFRGDFAQISQTFSGGGSIFGGGSSYGVDREKTYVSAWKNFPENLTVETELSLHRGRTTGGFDGRRSTRRPALDPAQSRL